MSPWMAWSGCQSSLPTERNVKGRVRMQQSEHGMTQELEMPESHREAIKVLRSFFAAMQDWENSCGVLSDRVEKGEAPLEEYQEIRLDHLMRIFTQFCEFEGEPNRAAGMHYCYPGAYNPEGEKILSVEEQGDKLIVHTQETTTGPNLECIYTLVQREDGWRVVDDKKQVWKGGQVEPVDL